MLKKIQKKSLSTRKKILSLSIISLIVLIVLPLWVFGLQYSLKKSKKITQESHLKNQKKSSKIKIDSIKNQFNYEWQDIQEKLEKLQKDISQENLKSEPEISAKLPKEK